MDIKKPKPKIVNFKITIIGIFVIITILLGIFLWWLINKNRCNDRCNDSCNDQNKKLLLCNDQNEKSARLIKSLNSDYDMASNLLLQYGKIGKLNLLRSKEFYDNNRDKTLTYLKAVYPTSPLKGLNSQDLSKLYNSLWTWYNCEAEFGPTRIQDAKSWVPSHDNVDKWYPICWQALPGCGTKWPKLPYAPQGWIYDWNKWILGNLDKMPEKGFDRKHVLGPQITYCDSSSKWDVKNMTGSVPGQTFWFWYNGPNPVWMYQRAIFRYVYNPNEGPSFKAIMDPPWNRIYATPALTPGDITDPNLPFTWNVPRLWWTGVPSGGFLEITMASEPGLAPSPPICWFDGWRGSGTWINVGKTLVARNKFAAVFKLAEEAAQTKEGKKQLINYYKSDDPYQICKNLLRGVYKCEINGPKLYDGRRVGGYDSKINNTYQKIIKFNFCKPAAPNQMSVKGLTQTNMNMALNYDIRNWFGWCDNDTSGVCPENKGKKKNDESWTNCIPNLCIDKIVTGSLFQADRQSALMTPDEPMFALGIYLGYDSIQLPHSSNGNGRYQFEYLELREYPKGTLNRDYSDFIMIINTVGKNEGEK